MKRGVLILVLAMIFLLPTVTASIYIDGPQFDEFNIGDKISIAGYVQQDEALSGFLKFSMQCNNQTQPLQMVPITVGVNEQLTFPNNLQIPEFVASGSMVGECIINAHVTVGGVLIDSTESQPFTITKELSGSFLIEEQRVQIGSDVIVSGEISKQDGDLVSGSAEIYFKQNNTKYLVNVLNFEEGQLKYTHTMTAVPEGRYFIDLLVRDTYGNEKLFQNAATFVLIRQLYLSANLDQNEYLPGDIVSLQGEARTILQEDVESGVVVVSMGSKTYTTQLSDGKFQGSFQLPYNVESGRHVVTITVKDEAGNLGISKQRLYVIPVPSTINIRTENLEILPGEILELTATLYDQASELLTGDLELEILDENENLILTKTISSSKSEIFKLPQFTEPGRWTIKVSKGELQAQEILDIKEKLDLGVVLIDGVLNLKNLGNTKFKDIIEIEAVGTEDSFILNKKKSIKENGTDTIDLTSMLPTGMYALNIKTSSGDHQFSNVNITGGKSWLSFNLAYLLLVISCVGLLVYMAYTRITPPKPASVTKRTFKVQRVESKKSQGPEKFSIHDIGKDKDAEMADFKSRILTDIKRSEDAQLKREQRRVFTRAVQQEPEEEKEDKGMFSMFG